MLDYPALLKQLEDARSHLFLNNQQELSLLEQLFDQISHDALLSIKLAASQEANTLTQWQGALASSFPVAQAPHDYSVCSVDGSQIYPDKHQGTTCFLINTGLVQLTYGARETHQRVVLNNRPHLYVEGAQESDFALSTELVNCRRQEWEFKHLLEYVPQMRAHLSSANELYLFDGSLIFWHLDSKDLQLKHTFLSCYLMLLHQLYELRVPLAGYISLPKAKDLIALMRASAEIGLLSAQEKFFEPFVDTNLAHLFLQPYTRSALFKSNAPISKEYPDHLRPYFFYLHVGDEIARIEIPGYVAADEQMTNSIASMLVDQSVKGRGYPVALAEAHEQAVIKGQDRELFYNLIYKLGNDYNHTFRLSQKSLKKRGIGI